MAISVTVNLPEANENGWANKMNTNLSNLKNGIETTSTSLDTVIANVTSNANAASAAATTASGAATTANAANVAAAAAGRLPRDIVSGAAYTLAVSDAGRAKWFNSFADVALTVPVATTQVAGDMIEIQQGGVGRVIVNGATTTVNIISRGYFRVTAGQYAVLQLVYIGNNCWHLSGDVDTTISTFRPGIPQYFPTDDGSGALGDNDSATSNRWTVDGGAQQSATAPAASGLAVTCKVARPWTGVRFWGTVGAVGATVTSALWQGNTELARSSNFVLAAGYNDILFATPYTPTVGATDYVYAVHQASGTHYYAVVSTAGQFSVTPEIAGVVPTGTSPARFRAASDAVSVPPNSTSSSFRRVDLIVAAS